MNQNATTCIHSRVCKNLVPWKPRLELCKNRELGHGLSWVCKPREEWEKQYFIKFPILGSSREFIWLEYHSVGHLENVVFSNNNNIHDCIFRHNSFQFKIVTLLNYENNCSLSIFIVWQEQENYKVGLNRFCLMLIFCFVL